MVLSVSVPGLVVWALGIPVFALYRLSKNLKNLIKIKHFIGDNTKTYDDLLHQFKIRLGFLTAGYQEAYFYWEIVLLMRKTIVVLLIVFLSQVSTGVQSLTAILLLSLFFVFH